MTIYDKIREPEATDGIQPSSVAPRRTIYDAIRGADAKAALLPAATAPAGPAPAQAVASAPVIPSAPASPVAAAPLPQAQPAAPPAAPRFGQPGYNPLLHGGGGKPPLDLRINRALGIKDYRDEGPPTMSEVRARQSAPAAQSQAPVNPVMEPEKMPQANDPLTVAFGPEGERMRAGIDQFIDEPSAPMDETERLALLLTGGAATKVRGALQLVGRAGNLFESKEEPQEGDSIRAKTLKDSLLAPFRRLQGQTEEPWQIEIDRARAIHQTVDDAMKKFGAPGAFVAQFGIMGYDLAVNIAMVKTITGASPWASSGSVNTASKGFMKAWAARAAKEAPEVAKMFMWTYTTTPGTHEERVRAAKVTAMFRATPMVSMGMPTNFLAMAADTALNQIVSLNVNPIYKELVDSAKETAKQRGLDWDSMGRVEQAQILRDSMTWQQATDVAFDVFTNVLFAQNTKSATKESLRGFLNEYGKAAEAYAAHLKSKGINVDATRLTAEGARQVAWLPEMQKEIMGAQAEIAPKPVPQANERLLAETGLRQERVGAAEELDAIRAAAAEALGTSRIGAEAQMEAERGAVPVSGDAWRQMAGVEAPSSAARVNPLLEPERVAQATAQAERPAEQQAEVPRPAEQVAAPEAARAAEPQAAPRAAPEPTLASRYTPEQLAEMRAAQDAEYMAAVERGDMETAQRIVDEAFATSAIAELSRYFDFAQNHPIRKSDPKLAHHKAISSYVSAIRRLYDGLVKMSGNKPNGNILEIGRLAELSEDSFARGDIGKAIQYGEMALQKYHIDAYDSTWRTDYTSKLFSEIEPAIVRDDKGRVIPPSERFNPKSDDIRFSVKANAPSSTAQEERVGEMGAQGETIAPPAVPKPVNVGDVIEAKSSMSEGLVHRGRVTAIDGDKVSMVNQDNAPVLVSLKNVISQGERSESQAAVAPPAAPRTAADLAKPAQEPARVAEPAQEPAPPKPTTPLAKDDGENGTLFSSKKLTQEDVEEEGRRKAASSIQSKGDADYMAAVERGDTATVQRMVDEALTRHEEHPLGRDENGKYRFRESVKSVGYRIGDIPYGGKSFNSQSGLYEKGVSLIGAGNLPGVRSFAISSLKDRGAKIVFVRGDVATEVGGDGEFIMLNPVVISKGEYDSALKSDAQAISDYVLASYRWNLSGSVGSGEVNKWIDETKKARQRIKDVVRDDHGRVIPLSERFNPQSEDIRFSLAKLVADTPQAFRVTSSRGNVHNVKMPDGTTYPIRAESKAEAVAKAQELASKTKPLSEMNDADLKKRAEELGVPYDPKSTAKELRDRIRAVQQGGFIDVSPRAPSKDDPPFVRQMKENDRRVHEWQKRHTRDAISALRSEVVDRQAGVKRALKGIGANDAIRRLVLRQGSGAEAARQFRVAEKSINDVLPTRYRELFKYYLQAMRVVEATQVQAERGIELKSPMSAEDAKRFLNDDFVKLPQEQQDAVMGAAKKYWGVMREQLDALYAEGLIGKEGYEAIATKHQFYSPRRFVEFIDPQTIKPKGEMRHDSGVDALDRGSESAMAADPMYLMAHVITRTQNRLFKNRANKALYDTAIASPENSVVRVLGKNETPTRTEDSVSVFIDGQEVRMAMPKELAAEWDGLPPALSRNMAELLQWAFGTKVLKTLATGVNPEFAISNLPRDAMYAWFTSGQYSSFLPKALGQLFLDYKRSMRDAIKRTGAYTDYVKEGGGMDFLTTQGMTRKPGIEGGHRLARKIGDILAWAGETSEIATRLAVRNRAIRNGLSPEEATYVARNMLDFSQGGTFAKAADNVIPYLNAAIQGTRGGFRAFKENPKVASFKAAQLIVIGYGLAQVAATFMPELWDSINEREKASKWIIPLSWTRKDKEGNDRHAYIAIPKDQFQQVFAAIGQSFVDGVRGNPWKPQIIDSLFSTIPVEASSTIPPIMNAALAYFGNYDTWTKENVWQGYEDISPSKEQSWQTPEIAVDIAELASRMGVEISPERLATATGKVVPTSNPLGSIMSSIYATGNPDPELGRTIVEKLRDIPGIRRILRFSRPSNLQKFTMDKAYQYNVDVAGMTDLQAREAIKVAERKRADVRYPLNIEADKIARQAVRGDVSSDDLQKWIDSVPQEERKRVESRIKAQYKKSWKSPLEIIRIVTDPGVENDPSKQAKSEWLAKYGMDGITAKDLRTALVKEAREQGWNREMYDSKGKLTAYGQRKLRLSRFIRKNNIE